MKKKKQIKEKPEVSIPGLRVKCKHCNTWVSKCKETGEGLDTCPHELSYLGVVHIPGTTHGRVVRDLGTNLPAAVVKLSKLREDVKNGILPKKKNTEVIPPIIFKAPHPLIAIDEKSQATMVEVMTKYAGFLNNVGVPKHKQRELSKDYKADIARAFMYFCGCLKKAGYEVENFPLSSLSDNEVGIFHEYLEEKKSSPYTYNRYQSYFTSFLAWAQKNDYKVKNVFEDVNRFDTEPDSRAISQEHFEGILPLVTHENGFQYTPGKKKEVRNVFAEFLKTGYILSLLTGRRREEVIDFRFSSIHPDFKTMMVEDFKPNRIKKRTKKKFVHVPITPLLRKFITEELEFEKYKGTDRHLLAPEVIEHRVENIGDALSRSFSHYYKQLGTGEVLTLKCLRKTYLTHLKIFLQKGSGKIDVKDISNHASDDVLDKHYFDKRLIAAALADSGFEVFPSRDKELKQIREQSKEKENEKDVVRSI